MKNIFLILFGIVISSSALARFKERHRVAAEQQGMQQATQMANTAQAGNTTTSTSHQSLEQSSKDTMQNSQKGQTVTTIMQIGFYAKGASYASMCSPKTPSNCVKAAVMFAMGSQAGRSASSFQAPIDGAWSNACTYSTLGCGSAPYNPYTAALTPGVINQGEADANAKEISATLEKGGYAVDANSGKIKTPTGELNANDPGSLEGALGSDGLGSLMGEVRNLEKDAKAKVDQVKQGAVTAALGFDGGGGGIGVVSEGGYDVDANGGASVASRIERIRNPAQAKGLTKNFNGDPIGVASDSIFEMMSRRYQLKSTQKTFFGAEVQ